MDDLFDRANPPEAPLAARLRPRKISEYTGQSHLLGEGKPLRRIIVSDQVASMIFYGPPGVGKTSLAEVIAKTTHAYFEKIVATDAGVADIKRALGDAVNRRRDSGQRTILFIDEIHRFNKAQQDHLLRDLECGNITLIGATTHNPTLYVIPPLISRAEIFELKSLSEAEMMEIFDRAIHDKERGLGEYKVVLLPEAARFLANIANGDARRALNGLERAVKSTRPVDDGRVMITQAVLEESMQRKAVVYDRDGDQHYDTISAFIKAMRGSDPDAALYWLAKMLEAGEDPRFIMRRVMIHAAEDVGMADPSALMVAVAADHALERVGLPEARIPIAQAVIHIALAPKSNSVVAAIDKAMEMVQQERLQEVPQHLRDAHYKGAAILGNGKGYLYPHDFAGGWVNQAYMPYEAEIYRPTSHGNEKIAKERLEQIKRRKDDKAG